MLLNPSQTFRGMCREPPTHRHLVDLHQASRIAPYLDLGRLCTRVCAHPRRSLMYRCAAPT